MKRLVLVTLMVLSLPSFATVTAGSCPQAFEGKVRAIAGSMEASAFSTQKVIFTNEHTVRGAVEDEVVLTMLENGPFKVEAGQNYRVQMRNGKLCWIEGI